MIILYPWIRRDLIIVYGEGRRLGGLARPHNRFSLSSASRRTALASVFTTSVSYILHPLNVPVHTVLSLP